MLPTIPADKANHFIYGLIITAMIAPVSIWFGLIICAATAGTKELVDLFDPNPNTHPDWIDFLATVAGGIICTCIYFLPYIK